MNSQAGGVQLPPNKGKRFDFIGFFQRRKIFILILGGFIFVLLVPFAMVKGSFSYETSGRLVIARELPTIVSGRDENIVNYFHDYAKTQVERIKGPIILEDALQSLSEEIRKKFQSPHASITTAIAQLQQNLVVEQIGGTHVIKLQLNGGFADGLAEMTNAIMKAYIKKLEHEEENKDTRRLDFLVKERDALKNTIKEQDNSIEKLVRSTKSSGFEENNNIFRQKFIVLQGLYMQAYNGQVIAENDFNQTKDEVSALKKLNNKVLADEMVAGDQSLWRTTSWTYEKLQELRGSIDGITKGNPDRFYVEQRMKAMEEYERKMRQDIRHQAEKIINEKRDYELSKKLVTAQFQYLTKQKAADELKSNLDKTLEDLERSSQDMLLGQQLLKSIENNRKKYFELENRIRDLVVESKAPVRVSIESYATKPESPSKSNKNKLMMMTLMASFGISAAVFFLYDFTDNRIRSPHDITNYLGRPPAWPIMDYTLDHPDPKSFVRVMLDDKNHTVAKAIRSLATRLNKERNQHEAKVALLNGVHEYCGATVIAINIAQAMTNFCSKVLMVEANDIRSGLPNLIQNPNEILQTGDSLNEQLDPEKLITRDEERQLDFLALGHLEWTPALHRQVPSLLQELKSSYDFIVIDSAPILKSDLTEMLVVQSDVEILIIQGDRTLFKDFVRTTELILRLEIPAMMTVLNWGGPRPLTRFDEMIHKLPFPFAQKLLYQLSGSKTSTLKEFITQNIGMKNGDRKPSSFFEQLRQRLGKTQKKG